MNLNTIEQIHTNKNAYKKQQYMYQNPFFPYMGFNNYIYMQNNIFYPFPSQQQNQNQIPGKAYHLHKLQKVNKIFLQIQQYQQ